MSRELDEQLLNTANGGDFVGVKVAAEAGADINVLDGMVFRNAARSNSRDALAIIKFLVEYAEKHSGNVPRVTASLGYNFALIEAAGSTNPDALAIVRYLVKQSCKDATKIVDNKFGSDKWAVRKAAESTNPDALAIVKYLVENGVNFHERNVSEDTALTIAFRCGNRDIADFLFFHDNFLLSDLMPCPQSLPSNTYETYRKKAMSRVSNLIDKNGFLYARTVAADIKKILGDNDPENLSTRRIRSIDTEGHIQPTKEDVEMLRILVEKISSMDWMSDTQVSCGDFQTDI